MMQRSAFLKPLVTAALALASAGASAAPQPLINYFQPMPIVGNLSTTVWGASTVGPRDPANGLEDSGPDGGVGPQQQANYYWDGKIVKGEDGKYHLYASYWPHRDGFGWPQGPSGTGWQASIAMQAVSDDIMGPYVFQRECYTQNQEGNNKGHNTTALIAPTGEAPFILSVGEIVAGQLFSSASANGPWTLLGLMTTNTNGHTGCGTLSSNFTFTVGPDNRFWATSRSGCILRSDQVLGTYRVETDSILPNLENNTNNNAEDEVIWYSGGYYHIVYNYWHVQRGYHIMSKDGLTNWTSTGLAYQGTQSPPNSNSNWLRYTDGTVNQWHNMERVGVYQENGHVTHFTFAVTDVDKNSSAINSGGSKILVVPFNGVQFDCDNGDPVSCAEIAGGGAGAGGVGGGGTAGIGGAPRAGSGGQAGMGATAGAGEAGGSGGGIGGVGGAPRAGSGGQAGVGATAGAGAAAGGGASGVGGVPATGGSDGKAGGGGTTGQVGTGGENAVGNGAMTGGRDGGQSGSTGQQTSSGGCGCVITSAKHHRAMGTLLFLVGIAGAVRRRRSGHRSRRDFAARTTPGEQVVAQRDE
jgi:MYXO-CTERM domain-containing protein